MIHSIELTVAFGSRLACLGVAFIVDFQYFCIRCFYLCTNVFYVHYICTNLILLKATSELKMCSMIARNVSKRTP